MIPMLAATLIIYLGAELVGVNPIIPVCVALIGEAGYQLFHHLRQQRKRRAFQTQNPKPIHLNSRRVN